MKNCDCHYSDLPNDDLYKSADHGGCDKRKKTLEQLQCQQIETNVDAAVKI